jgi:hypothetical protein
MPRNDPSHGDHEEEHDGLLTKTGPDKDSFESDTPSRAGSRSGQDGSELARSSFDPSRKRSHAQMGVREAVRAYPSAIFWSLAVSTCVIMEGFDSILVPSFYAFPTFQRKCQSSDTNLHRLWLLTQHTDGDYVGVTQQTQSGYQLSATWMAVVRHDCVCIHIAKLTPFQIGTASGSGAVFGTLLNGVLVDRYGQKRVLIGALCSLSCFIFMTVFAPNIGVLAVGQFLCVCNPCPNQFLSFVGLLVGMNVLLTQDLGISVGHLCDSSTSIRL